MAFNDKITFLLKYSFELDTIEKENKEEELKIQIRHREKVEPLFVERQKLLQENPKFWSGVLASPATPVASLMNGTFDTRITRAITDFQVKTRSENGKLIHQILVIFSNNIMVEAGTVFREVDSDGNTVSVQPIKWMKGSENLRTNSLFSFFDENPTLGEDFIEEAAKAFDLTFQDPFLAMEPDN